MQHHTLPKNSKTKKKQCIHQISHLWVALCLGSFSLFFTTQILHTTTNKNNKTHQKKKIGQFENIIAYSLTYGSSPQTSQVFLKTLKKKNIGTPDNHTQTQIDTQTQNTSHQSHTARQQKFAQTRKHITQCVSLTNLNTHTIHTQIHI